MKRFVTALFVAGSLAAATAPAHAKMRLEEWKGHISLGFAHAFADSLAPAGSMSVSGGVDYPLTTAWRVGPVLSFNLLGSTNVTRDLLTAGLDYSLLEAAVMFTHVNAHGPINRWSVGPGVASPHAELSIAYGGLGFRDLPVSGVRPELAADVTVMSRHMPLVAVGLELGARVVPIPSRATWTLLSGRLAIHF